MGRVGVGTRVGLGCLGIRGVWRGHGGNTTERVEKKEERRMGKASCRHRRAGLVTRQEHASACQLHSYVPRTDACTRDMRYACGAALAVCHACMHCTLTTVALSACLATGPLRDVRGRVGDAIGTPHPPGRISVRDVSVVRVYVERRLLRTATWASMTPASASSQPGSCDNVTLNSPLASRPATPEESAAQGENGECPSEHPPSLASPHHHRPQLDRVLSRSPSSSSRSFDVPDGHEQHTLSFQNTSSPSLHALEREHFPPILEGKATGNGIEAEDGDLSAPFESIPLSSTPPREALTAPLPSSPREMLSPKSVKKRRSWGGFGMSSDGHQTARGELPEHPAPHTSQSAGPLQPTHDKHNGEGLPERASTATPTPRRAAPPPHPFPWPIPTSPPPSSSKRLSIISNASSGTHATQASQGSATATCPHAPGQGQAQTHQHAPGLGVKGVSTFEKVISHTRPSWLPPKDRIEDVTHLHQWEDMMRHAREHEKVLAKQAEIRRLEKEKRLAAEAPKWEKLLSDEKDFSVKKVKENEALRKLWFEGVPSHLRGKAWSMAVGNPLALSKGVFPFSLFYFRCSLSRQCRYIQNIPRPCP